jgi:hypothetical protein
LKRDVFAKGLRNLNRRRKKHIFSLKIERL